MSLTQDEGATRWPVPGRVAPIIVDESPTQEIDNGTADVGAFPVRKDENGTLSEREPLQLGRWPLISAAGLELIPAAQAAAFRISASPIEADFGVSTVFDTAALDFLSRLPPRPVGSALAVIRSWLTTHPQVIGVRVRKIDDPEATDWTEVVFELLTSADVAGTLELWADLAARINELTSCLLPPDAQVLNRHLGIHFVPPVEADDVAAV